MNSTELVTAVALDLSEKVQRYEHVMDELTEHAKELEAELRRYQRWVEQMDGLLRDARGCVTDDKVAYEIDMFLEDK